MNIAIFKNLFKSNYKLILIFFIVLNVYLGVIISLIDTTDMEQVKELFKTMEGMMQIFGINIDAMTSPLAYTSSTFFGVLITAFTMVFYILLVNKLIVKPIESTSIIYTLSTPVTRKRIIFTQIIFLVTSILIIFIGILTTGSIMLNSFGNFDFMTYFNLVSLSFLLCLIVALVSYTLAIIFTNTKFKSLYLIVPIGFIIINMLANAVGDKLKLLNKLTPFGWFDSIEIVNGNVNSLSLYLMFTVSIIILSIISIEVFNKKDLSV